MHSTILTAHSLIRWLVLLSLLYAIYRAYRGWLGNKAFTEFDNTIRHTTATIAHTQLFFGLWLYFTSPIIRYFLSNFKDAIHEREMRFFGMEHSSMMFLAVVIITLASAKAKRQSEGNQKFKTLAIGFTIALLIILSTIPWSFSPLTSRPYIRFF